MIRVRKMLELEDGRFVRPSQIDDAAMANSALAVVRMQLKEALHGLSPLFTKQVLLSVCESVVNEDIRADVAQFKQDMQQTSTVVGTAVRGITKNVIEMNAGWLAAQGTAGTTTLAFGRLIPVVGQVVLAYKAVTAVKRGAGYAQEVAHLDPARDRHRMAEARSFPRHQAAQGKTDSCMDAG